MSQPTHDQNLIQKPDLQAIFIDRDGTIGGSGHFLHPKEFTRYPNAVTALALLKSAGLKLLAFTNQHRIASGEATMAEFIEQFKAFGFENAYICPHALEVECECRKPNPVTAAGRARI